MVDKRETFQPWRAPDECVLKALGNQSAAPVINCVVSRCQYYDVPCAGHVMDMYISRTPTMRVGAHE